MKEYKVPIQSLIDHIKTACDVDPWAKEMAEELLKEQEAVDPVSDPYVYWLCGSCGKKIDYRHKYCPWCGKQVKWK